MPKKSLSQNFLHDREILNRIADAAAVSPEDTILEIGPGPGTLTRVLLDRAAHVVAVELDHGLCKRLIDKFRGNEKLTLIQGDALKYPLDEMPDGFKAVANIPYHITTPIIFRLLEYGHKLKSMTLTVQKEVAERVAAGPGNKSYGVLSIMVQYRGLAELKFIVPRGAFKPVPKVDSACLHIDVLQEPPVQVADEQLFFRLVRTSFTHRRKTLPNSLKQLSPDMARYIKDAGIDTMRRPETLSMHEFAHLANSMNKAGFSLPVAE